jgi:cyclopropane fatty-acyl-phospholipid synthase-like methyltransferase
MGVQQRAEALAELMFLGGPVKHFTTVGRNQLAALLHNGLEPESKVLDVGCGALRGGYWIMRVLDSGNYFGIEPARAMLQAGLDDIVEPDVIARARPTFDHNDRFDFTVFDTTFDFVVARSIWTHASKTQIIAMLDSFVATATDDAVFLTSVLPVTDDRPDYQGEAWVGRSHESDVGGTVAHDPTWLEAVCAERSLTVAETGPNVLHQQWLAITKTGRRR